ncbi:MAG: hypothetical protein IJU87_02575 [Lachnospiraceae bacterium]|nr:hypothetical protein [Lachnospiraceae bacterium]
MANNQLVIGIDLSEKFTLISICHDPGEGVVTYSTDKDKGAFRIPVAAFKLPGSEKHVFGEEAVSSAAAFKMKYETSLLESALESSEKNGLNRDDPSIVLLGKFLSFLLRLPEETAYSRVNSLCITQRKVHPLSGKVIMEAVKSAGIGIPSIRVISYAESFFFYALSQPIELWRDGVLLYDYSDTSFESDCLIIDRSTSPAVVRNRKRMREEMVPFSGSELKKLDERFAAIAMEDLKSGVSGTYLTGEAFNERWEQKTLRVILSRSRVFKGQNLYSKGACYAAADSTDLIRISRRYVYFGEDSISSNVSIRALSEGKEILIPVADAGDKWYETEKTLEVMVGQDRELIVVITDILDRDERNKVIRLDFLPVRPDRAGRVKLEFSFLSAEKLTVTITDLGFGEIFRSTDRSVKEEILI